MTIIMVIVAIAVFIFASELLRVDVGAILIMTLLGLLIYVPGLEGMLTPDVLYSGFSSNAVISIIAVMILGGGLDKSGAMQRVAWAILHYGGKTEKQIVSLISGTVAVISSFMQNVGAAALFLPVVSRISSQTRFPMSRLVMPMGFCAIVGGTMTMVGDASRTCLGCMYVDLLCSIWQKSIAGWYRCNRNARHWNSALHAQTSWRQRGCSRSRSARGKYASSIVSTPNTIIPTAPVMSATGSMMLVKIIMPMARPKKVSASASLYGS